MRPTFGNRNSPKYISTRSGRWVSSVAAATSTSTTSEDQALLRWPRRSRDLTPCYFFLWGRFKDSVFPPPLPQDLYEMWRRIVASISEINRDVLQRVWAEVDIDLNFAMSRRVDIQSTCDIWKKTWTVPLSTFRSHVSILSTIQMYSFYEMCLGITNNPVFRKLQDMKFPPVIMLVISNSYCIWP
jgi:hypothetical protein